jgi:hypothetical protein
MTEVNKKRTLQGHFAETKTTDLTRKRTKTAEPAKVAVVSIKDVRPQKQAKDTDISNQAEQQDMTENDKFGYAGLLSLFSVCQSQPSTLKSTVDELLLKKQDSNAFRVVFLYFFQMAGVDAKDNKTLATLFEFIDAKPSNSGKAKEMSKELQDSLKFDIDQAMIFGQSKLAQTHLRLFKKLCKLLVNNLVDLFPAKKDFLIDVIQEVCNLSRLRVRLVRYAFTYIGMILLKNLLAQAHSLEVLHNQFKSQPSVVQS